MSKQTKSSLLLLLTAFIWGTAFVAQKNGAHLGALTYNGIRTLIGGLVLIPVIRILDCRKKATNFRDINTPKAETEVSALTTPKARDSALTDAENENKILIFGSIALGIVLFAGSTLQQYGITFTTVGKSGFITSLYAVEVPIFSIAIGKKVRPVIWLCVLMGVTGLYLLCMNGADFTLQKGDFFVCLCTLFFALQIMIIDYCSPKCDPIRLACNQFIITGLICIVLMFFFEDPDIHEILRCWAPILYGGFLSVAVGYTLQMVGQKNTPPTQASLILCLESVFSALAGAVLLGESMSPRQLIGCVIIFAAVVISQLPEREKTPAAEA